MDTLPVVRIKAKIKTEYLHLQMDQLDPTCMCDVCCEPVESLQDMCPAHKYCAGCIVSYLEEQSTGGGKFRCMGDSCNASLTMEQIRTFTADAPIAVRQKIVLAYKGQSGDGKCEYCHGAVVKVRTPHPRQPKAYYLKRQCTLCDECYCARCNKKMHKGLCQVDPAFKDQKIDHCPNCNEGYVLEAGCTSVRCSKCQVNFSFQNANALYSVGDVNVDDNGALIWEGISVHSNDPHMIEYANAYLPALAPLAPGLPRVPEVRPYVRPMYPALDALPEYIALPEAKQEDFTTESYRSIVDRTRVPGRPYLTVDMLKRFCSKNNFKGYSKYCRSDLIDFIYKSLNVPTE